MIRKKVAIFGCGVGGLTVAHELSKFTEYDIVMYEKKDVVGGLARSSRDTNGCATEYCWRAYFDFYDNLFQIMREIPLIENGNKTVINNLVDCRNTNFSDNGFTLKDKFIGFKKILFGVTSSDARLDLLDNISWWQSLEGTDSSHLLRAIGPWLGADRYSCSYKSVIKVGFEMDIIPKLYNNYFNYVTTKPTSEAWFQHWEEHLINQGVDIQFNTELDGVDVENNQIVRVHTSDGKHVNADYYVFAMPVEVLARIIDTSPILKQGQLAHMTELSNRGFQMELSFQLYFDRSISLGTSPSRGPNNTFFIIDSPWDIVILQYDKVYDEVKLCNDIPEVKGGWSVAVCTAYVPGIVYGKPFNRCSYDEMVVEMWQQIYNCNTLQQKIYDENGYTLEKEMVIKWSPMWPSYSFDGEMLRTFEPKFTNNVGTGALRPSYRTHIPNLFISTAYIKETIDIFSMEAAAIAGKHVSNAINDNVSHPTIRTRPIIFLPFRSIDDLMFRYGLPNIGPTIIYCMILFVIIAIIYSVAT